VVSSLDEETDKTAYWLTATPEERLQAVEVMRQIVYGYAPSSQRLQRFFKVAELQSS